MTPAPLAVISAACFEMGDIGKAVVWSLITQFPKPKVLTAYVLQRVSMDLGHPYSCLAQVARLLSVGAGIAAVEAAVVLPFAYMFSSGKRRSDGRVV